MLKSSLTLRYVQYSLAQCLPCALPAGRCRLFADGVFMSPALHRALSAWGAPPGWKAGRGKQGSHPCHHFQRTAHGSTFPSKDPRTLPYMPFTDWSGSAAPIRSPSIWQARLPAQESTN